MQALWSPWWCSLQPGIESLLSLAGSCNMVLCVPVTCRHHPLNPGQHAGTTHSATGRLPNRWQSALEARPGATRTASPQRTGWKRGSSRAASWRRASQSPWLAGVPLLSNTPCAMMPAAQPSAGGMFGNISA